jgi:ABC-type multidrug transport system fused ATPase/permease subunit
MFLQRNLLRLAGDLYDRVAVGSAIGVGITACDMSQAVLSAVVLGRILRGEFTEVGVPLGAIALLILIRAGLIIAREFAAKETGHLVKRRVRGKIFDHLVKLGPGYLMRERTGNLQAITVDSVEQLEPYCARYLPAFGVALLSSVLVLGYIAWMAPLLAVILAVFLVLTPLSPQLWMKRLEPRNKVRWRLWSELASEFVDSTQGITTLKLFDASGRKRDELHQRSLALYRAQMKQLYLALVVESLTVLATAGGAAVVIVLGALFVTDGTLDATAMLIILLLAREAFRPWVELSTYWHLGINANAGAGRIVALLDTKPEVEDTAAATAPQALAPTIGFGNVQFGYSTRNKPALNDISFEVAAGETVAIVGASGSGKTTIVSLLLRFFDPQGGAVRIGGHDLRTLPLASVRQTIALVSQDTYLFQGTIGENIGLGREGASQSDIEAAARNADIAGFIATLPQDYDTPVSERGLSLSGGQRQRIAIARAFLKDAPILVLDEATSNVDVASEGAIQRALARLSAGRTTLIVAHRLSTIRHADRIIVLDQGKVVESGTHVDLLARGGGYARLVQAQEEAA